MDEKRLERPQYGLTLSRNKGQSILIGDDIELTYVEGVGQIRLNIKAPLDVVIVRKELCDKERKKDVY